MRRSLVEPEESIWRSNLMGTKQHLSLTGWTDRGTGIVAVCDKKGIFLTDASVEGLPHCRSCQRSNRS